MRELLARGTVDVGAVLDFSSSFGTVVLAGAGGLVGGRQRRIPRTVGGPGRRPGAAVPAAAYGKNAADIRLAVDAVEDMFRLPDLTHVVIVAGDSDYIPGAAL